MRLDDYTFAMLAKAVATAGGSVHVTASDILRLNAGFVVDIRDDGKGGQILTLVERAGVAGIEEIQRRAAVRESER